MSYKMLFIFVEGPDDERFFKKIIEPIFIERYNFTKVLYFKYAQEKDEKVDNFIKSIKCMGAEYIYVADINNSPCVTHRKEKIKKHLKNIDTERIMVVIKEIESWYLAGLNNNVIKKWKIKIKGKTDNITKEQFNNMIPKKFESRIDFMIEALKNFSIEIAKQKNNSFRYFLDRFIYKLFNKKL